MGIILRNIYEGISVANKIFFGFGRTWNASLRYKF